MKEAYAWLQNRLVGRFFEGSDGATRFEYAPEASMLISLSLPLDDFWQVDAPGAFLDGLLPDNDSEREGDAALVRRGVGRPARSSCGNGHDGRTVLHVGSRAGGDCVSGSRVCKGKGHRNQGLPARARLDDVAVR